MLRVRPIVYTADPSRAAAFLQALGLTPAADPLPNASYAVFDAGSGRVALHACAVGSTEEGTAALGFEVGDVREFARRTAEAGTAVDVSEEGHALAARVTSPDGASFLADAGPRETGAPASPLSVVARWYSPDLAAAVRVLEDIGARPGTRSDAGTWHDFRAKNGGLVAARAGYRTAVDVAFEFEDDVRDLVPGLIGSGFEPAVVVVEGHGKSLRIPAPWGRELWINERQRGLEGHPVH